MTREIKKHFRSTAVLVAVLTAFGAFAADAPAVEGIDLPNIDGKTRQVRPELVKHAAVAGMPVDLPAGAVTPNAELALTARSGERVLVRQTMVLPAELPGTVTVTFLASHGEELRKLRMLAKASPEKLSFTVSVGNRVIVDLPFAQADAGSAALAEGAEVVGQPRTVTVNLKDPTQVAANGLYPDPVCESACQDAFLECDLNCDHRGSCTYCNEQYEECVFYCPQLCSEPKQVYEYGTSWAYAYSVGEYICIQNYYRYILWSDFESRDIYERTVHCNNTFTDVWKRTETRFDQMCKTYHSIGCVGNMYPPPPNC